jgi:hypothetical protein
MTNLTKAWAVGLLVLALPMTGAAQQQPGGRAQAGTDAGDEGHQHHRFLVLHALSKAIEGSELQFAAQLTRGGRPQNNQGQEADDRRDRRDDNQRDRAAGNRQEDNQDRQRNPQANQQLASQLEQQARQEFAVSNRLLDAVGDDLRSDEARGDDRGNERTAWTRRLQRAADRYNDTLRTIAGVRERGDRGPDSVGNRGDRDDDQNRRADRERADRDRERADRDRERADRDRDQAGRNDSDRNAQQPQRLSRGDLARVFLINHAVRQASEAYFLNQTSSRQPGNNAAARGGSGQRLQERARQLEADSNQILQRVQASANRPDNDDERRDQDQNRDRRNQDQDQAGRASVRELAQQAQQLIDALQRINANETRGR